MGVSPRAHTVIKLAVGLLTVDDVEAVRDASSHAAHLEVEPLLVLAAIHISVDQQVVLPPAKSEARLEGYGSSKDRPTLRSYTPRVPEDGSKTRDLSRLVSYSDCAHLTKLDTWTTEMWGEGNRFLVLGESVTQPQRIFLLNWDESSLWQEKCKCAVTQRKFNHIWLCSSLLFDAAHYFGAQPPRTENGNSAYLRCCL